jgi:demethylmenaquinone methyltransferase/2-methoxy-6-polyprenyl-1,4-benzoquinol methylase
MFDSIAGRYDLLNRVLSGGLDRRWRRRAIQALGLTGRETVLDVCTGTADVALEAARGGAARVVGVDFAHEMLRLGHGKARDAALATVITLVRGDAMSLPLPDASVDAATIAFGIRNVQDPSRACRELSRVLRPGGRIALLEFALPRAPVLRTLYRKYFVHVLPRLGGAVSGHGEAYKYLPASVAAFPEPPEFLKTIAEAGFAGGRADPLTFGTVYLYTARRR